MTALEKSRRAIKDGRNKYDERTNNEKKNNKDYQTALAGNDKTAQLHWTSSLQYVKGVGPKTFKVLQARQLENVRDLFWELPRTYQWLRFFTDPSLAYDTLTLERDLPQNLHLIGQVIAVRQGVLGPRFPLSAQIWVGGSDPKKKFVCRFFKVPFRQFLYSFTPGARVRIQGEVTWEGSQALLIHPVIEVVGKDFSQDFSVTSSSNKVGFQQRDDLVPVYSESEGVSSSFLVRLVNSCALQLLKSGVGFGSEEAYFHFARLHRLKDLNADEWVDRNLSFEYQNKTSMSHDWFKKQEAERFLFPHVYSLMNQKKIKGKALRWNEEGFAYQVQKNFGFPPTGFQAEVFSEIVADLQKPVPMQRLLQGDVGSGKTLVALLSAATVLENSLQVCLLAPTEILAIQIFEEAKKLFSPLSVRVEIILGSKTSKEKKALMTDFNQGKIHFLIGTHALLNPEFKPKALGLLIIDEQHRFGVEQRAHLIHQMEMAAGESNTAAKLDYRPHVLAMTATPIPRSLAQTFLGDWKLSELKGRPPGRKVPFSEALLLQSRDDKINHLTKFFQLGMGRKGSVGFYVCPAIQSQSQTEKGRTSVVEVCEDLRKFFPQVRWGVLHGKIDSKEKEEILTAFKSGDIQCLVTTTLIEVGVSIPQADFIIVEDADCFGLAQLHQLRGRVGRSGQDSWCWFLTRNPDSFPKLQELAKMTDGFQVAELDFANRGFGDLEGSHQSGWRRFKVLDPRKDLQFLLETRLRLEKEISLDLGLEEGSHSEWKLWAQEYLRSRGQGFPRRID